MSAADSEWNEGPPPAVGWYPASIFKNAKNLRYWNGRRWSQSVLDVAPAVFAEYMADQPCSGDDMKCMLWQHQPRDWPENARTYER